MLFFDNGVLCSDEGRIEDGRLVLSAETVSVGQSISVTDCGSASTDLEERLSHICACDGDCHGGRRETVRKVRVARIVPITRVVGFQVSE